MTSKQLIAVATAFGFLAFASAGWANPAGDACAALTDVRGALYSMVSAKDKPAQDAFNAKMRAATARLDSDLAGMTGADAKVAANFKAVWDQFKATRDQQIIPALREGRISVAKKIADGVQLARLSKMWSIISCK